MPVLKVKNNGVWETITGNSAGMPAHTHEIDDITNFPSSLPANGGNADTVDGKHANEFALASDVEDLQTRVGDKSVAEQVSAALEQAKASGEFDGQKGEPGKDGGYYQPIFSQSEDDSTMLISFNRSDPEMYALPPVGIDLPSGPAGYTPVKGVDYLVPTTDSTEQPSYGPELANSSGWTTAGWTGDFASGFTHTSGNTSPLIFTMPENTETNLYRISFKCSVSLAVEALMVKCGNSDLFDLYGQVANPIIIGVQSISNGNIEFVPASNFTGKITEISIKKVLSGFESEHTITDSNGENSLELRATKASQNNLFFGKNSGKQNISGLGCAGFGTNALESNTSGFWNVGAGYNALQNNTVGSRNVGIGYIALQSNVTGTRNIGIGPFALHSNTTGNKNVAIGADCMDKNVSGSENVAIGLQALYANVSGNFNTAVGSGALTKNTGSNNTAVGMAALAQCTSGNNNVGIGYNAGNAITTGKENLAIGTNSLYKLKTGTGNIGIGIQAGRGQGTTAGFKYGTFIGYQTGYSLANDADYNIMMGYQAGYSATTGDNNIFIGNKAGYNTTTGHENILIGSYVDAPTGDQAYWLNIGNLLKGSIKPNVSYLEVNGGLRLPSIPTSAPSNGTEVWNNNGVLMVGNSGLDTIVNAVISALPIYNGEVE